MSSRPLKLPGHRPLSRPEDRDRPFQAAPSAKRDPRLGPVARCLSRGRRPGSTVPAGRVAADAVTAREAALRRVQRIADVHAAGEKSVVEVRRDLIDALLHLRVLSLEVVEAVEQWRGTNSRANMAYNDPTTGENYLLKMKDDTKYLADHPVGEILTFSSKHDPFFVVPSARDVQRAPTNQMTPTLQARRREQGGVQKKAVLPLQPSLLRRIHRAELVLLKEAVQARVLRAAASPGREAPGSPPARQPAEATARPDELAREAAAEPAAAPAKPSPEPPAEQPGPFSLKSVGATRETIRGVYEEYAARAEPRLVKSLEQWPTMEPLLEEEGSGAPEWFWLFRAEGGSGLGVPDGLAVFRLKRMSQTFGQLLHLSVVDLETLSDAIEAVKQHMFAWLPISKIRVTLWYSEGEEGDLKLDKGVEKIFKERYFKWFQLTNQNGIRGQVMQTPRGEPPDFPPQPVETPCVALSAGQVWMRGCSEASALSPLPGPCAWNLVLAAACLRCFFAKDTSEAKSASDAAAAPAKEAAREGLMRALVSGELEKLLAAFVPVSLDEAPATTANRGSARSTPEAALALRVARSLEASGHPVPGVICEGCAGGGAEMVRRGTSAGAFAEALAGLGVDRLPDALAAAGGLQDVSFGRLFVTLEWHSVATSDDGMLDLPVVSVGKCHRHRGPVLYVATSEEDTFVVILPWEGVAPPRQEALFAVCADVLRETRPQDPAPYTTVRLPSFSVPHAVRTTSIADSAALGMSSRPALHVSEFGSLSVCAGRDMPGRLRRPGGSSGACFTAQKPFAFCIWHTDIDELNVPLAAMMVA